MSKRNSEMACNNIEPEAKRRRTSLSSERRLSKLSQDELCSIVEFLPVGEVLMLCLTCKSLHEEIVAILRNMAPFVAQKPWTISKAYSTRNQLELWTSEHVSNLCGALEDRAGHKIPSNLSIQSRSNTDITKDDLIELLGAESGETEIRKVVKVDWTDPADESIKQASMFDGVPDEYHIFEKIEEKVAVTRGFEVRKLELNSQVLPRMDVYRILSQCPNLDTLQLHVTDDPENAQPEVNTYGATIPVMNQLKSLKITRSYYGAGMQFTADILQLCPNLESLIYEFHKEPYDQFLDFLAIQCPKLKVLKVAGEDGAKTMESGFTDEGILCFLDRMPEMNTLLLYHCCNVSGEVFTKIGKYSKLKSLCIERTGTMVDEYDNVHFGGGVLTELETLALEGRYKSLPDNFGESLAATAPNLKKFLNNTLHQFSRVMLPKLTHANIFGRVGNNLDALSVNNLESVKIVEYENNTLVEYIKKSNWGNMNKMKLLGSTLPEAPDQWLRAIVNSCPCMEVFRLKDDLGKRNHDRTKTFVDALLQVLSDASLWPNLSILDVSAINKSKDAPQLQSQILHLRPLLVLNDSVVERPKRKRKQKRKQTEQEFIYNWLALEPIRASRMLQDDVGCFGCCC